jgi:uncharacterized UPF0160 family protein
MIIATHSGKFHADDVWAVATLDMVFPGADIIRTRDPGRVAAADFAVDVGGIWDAQTGRFDHHQKDFEGARASGVAYASAGLVWKAHGARCVALVARQHLGHALGATEAQEIAWSIDGDLVQYLDMADNGAARNAPGGYGLSAVVSGFNPNWMEEAQAGSPEAAEALRLSRFRRAMALIADVIVNNVKYRVGAMLGAAQVQGGERLEGGRLLLLPNSALPWTTLVRREMPEVLFVISRNLAEDRYMLHTVPASGEGFEARCDLPAAWGGLRDEALQQVTGVADAQFCHKGLFIAAAKSFDGALALARQALAAAPQGFAPTKPGETT